MNDNPDNGVNSSNDNAEREVFKISIYNAKLYGETANKEFASTWLSFPTTTEAVQAALQEIGVDGKNYSRYAIDEKESGITGLADCISDYEDINELNYLAVKIRDMDEINLDKFCAIIDKDSRSDDIAELINALDNFDCYDLQPVFNAKMYGEFLIEVTLDEIGTTINGLYGKSEAESYGKLMSRIDEIGKYVDAEKYGRQIVKLEKGSFTDFGYLTESDDKTILYHSKEDIPPEYKVFAYPDDERRAGLYKIENTDISDFLYKLHVLAGDYTGDIQNNIRMLPDGVGEDYIIIMNSYNIRITDAELTYQDHSDINSVFRKFPHDTRAYLFHIDERENNWAYGSIVMVDCGALSEDIDKNSISFISVTADIKGGIKQDLTREEWDNLKHIDHDKIQNLQYIFNPADIKELSVHREEFFKLRLGEAETIAPDTLLDYLNAIYMSEANYSQPGMFRVPQETAKTMLLHEDTPVYRLTPRSVEQLSIITAAKNGLKFENFREFAVKKDNKAGIDKMCKRETDKLTSKLFEQKDTQKRDKTQPDL